MDIGALYVLNYPMDKKNNIFQVADGKNGAEPQFIESEISYRQLFEDNPLPMWLYNVGTLKFVDVNNAAVSHYGYSKEEFLSMTIKEIRPEQEIKNLIQDLAGRVLPMQRSGIWKHKKKDGTIIDVEITSHSIKRKHHQDLRLVLANDVSELLEGQREIKDSLREKETLLKEIHHRVKNNLQVITSLLKLQSLHVQEPQLLYIIKETQNRIMAMSFAHQKLYQSKNFSDVDFREYLEKIVHQIIHIFATESKNVNITMNSESVKLGIETAIPCGMLVNEVITNSIKHAFPNDEKGEIKIGFKKADGDYYRLTISDNGIGMSDKINIAEAKTLGLQLIETLAKQIDAKLELHRNNGMEYCVTFKPVRYKKRV